jgi:hypothetical protein
MEPLHDLGLWGDLDEIDAIRDGFEALGLKPIWDDAESWVTVGDVWKSISRVAPEATSTGAAWDQFRRGISSQTGVDWQRVGENTALLDGRGGHPFTRMAITIREWFAKNRA